MNIRLFKVALLASAIPISVWAGTTKISLNKGDFISTKCVSQKGDTVLSLRLSKSGKAKVKKLNQKKDNEIQVEIAGVVSRVKMRDLIRGDGLEIGPYVQDEVNKVVRSSVKWPYV